MGVDFFTSNKSNSMKTHTYLCTVPADARGLVREIDAIEEPILLGHTLSFLGFNLAQDRLLTRVAVDAAVVHLPIFAAHLALTLFHAFANVQ